MASLSYISEAAQLIDIATGLGPERLDIMVYDDLIGRSEILLSDMFSFLSIPYDELWCVAFFSGAGCEGTTY